MEMDDHSLFAGDMPIRLVYDRRHLLRDTAAEKDVDSAV